MSALASAAAPAYLLLPMTPQDRTADLERRIVELEVKVSFQERTIDDLDAVIRELSARLEALSRELTRQRELAAQGAPSTADVLAALDDGLP